MRKIDQISKDELMDMLIRGEVIDPGISEDPLPGIWEWIRTKLLEMLGE